MPVYDYQCSECGKNYDVFHRVREIKEDVICPNCSSARHVRLISAPAFSMKGRGGSSFDPAPSCGNGSCCGGSCEVNS
jgi:putative FmdB family regulatory protein